jgi:hypothetical protein
MDLIDDREFGFKPHEGMVEYVPSPGHGEGYEYRVAYGTETTPLLEPSTVYKVNFVTPPSISRHTGLPNEHGRAYGRHVVAYPSWGEAEAVFAALTRLHAKVSSL